MIRTEPVDLRPYARDTLTLTLTDLPADWAGWTFAGQIRATRDDTGTLIATFTVDHSQLLTKGIIVYTIAAVTMQALPVDTRWWFDLRASNGGVEHTIIPGTITLTENVTVI